MNGLSHRPAGVAVEVRGLAKSFGTTWALAGVDLDAEPGRVLALLGPNGAGKTTLVRIIATLLRPDGGSAHVGGLDVVADGAAVRPLIGLTGQFAAIDDLLTGRENLEMVGELCQLRRVEARRRAAGLLAQVSLEDAADRLARTYSGGMRRRLDLAASLIAGPPLLVLDEPTTGLDPRTRADLWTMIANLAADGTTVLLTTQYLEEADRLAHQVVVLDRGKIAAEGTPAELKARLGGTVVELHAGTPGSFSEVLTAVQMASAGSPAADPDRGRITLPASDGTRTLRAVLDQLDAARLTVDDIGLRQPSLDEVFLALTGKGADAPGPALAGSRGSRAGRRNR
jgi:ABC-2 type transport system ATP-binding protein